MTERKVAIFAGWSLRAVEQFGSKRDAALSLNQNYAEETQRRNDEIVLGALSVAS